MRFITSLNKHGDTFGVYDTHTGAFAGFGWLDVIDTVNEAVKASNKDPDYFLRFIRTDWHSGEYVK